MVSWEMSHGVLKLDPEIGLESSGYSPLGRISTSRARVQRPELSSYLTLQSTLYDFNMEIKGPPLYNSGNSD